MNAHKKILPTILTLALVALCLCLSGCAEPDAENDGKSQPPRDSAPSQQTPDPVDLGGQTTIPEHTEGGTDETDSTAPTPAPIPTPVPIPTPKP